MKARPFVNGAHPSAADFQLLPWLERAEAYLPHVAGDAMLQQQSGTRAVLCAGCSRQMMRA